MTTSRGSRLTNELQRPALSHAEIDIYIERRDEARRAGNFRKADNIRDKLASYGIRLEDGPHGTDWRRE